MNVAPRHFRSFIEQIHDVFMSQYLTKQFGRNADNFFEIALK